MSHGIPSHGRSICPHGFRGVAAGLLAWGLTAACMPGADPHIEKIETFSTNQILVHFDTEANRDYRLEYIDSLLCTSPAACATNPVPRDWVLLFHWPRAPFANHFIVADTRTNAQRSYRLKVTP